MKTYIADKELENILLSYGLIETTVDKLKGKKTFKLSKSARKEVFFDYETIYVRNGIHGNSTYRMTETELQCLLLFFKLSSNDFKEFDPNGNFDFKSVEERMPSLRREYEKLKELNIQKSRRDKIERILQTFDNINLQTPVGNNI